MPQTLHDGLTGQLKGGQLQPKTVIWLNELQNYLADSELGDKNAAALQDLLALKSDSPILALGTLWPEHWKTLTRQSKLVSMHPRHVQAQILLSGRDVEVPETFDRENYRVLLGLERAATEDPRWREAIRAAPERPTQFLAGAYALLHRYQHASTHERAILHAAVDARRLGGLGTIPGRFLRVAAHGYLHADAQQMPRGQRETWFTDSLESLEEPTQGVPGPLTLAPSDPILANEHYQLAHFLEEHLGRERALLAPPSNFWQAAIAQLDKSLPLQRLGDAADIRGRFRHAADLYQQAAEINGGAPYGQSGGWPGRTDGSDSTANRSHHLPSDGPHVGKLLYLARQREESGDREGAASLYSQAAEFGNSVALLHSAMQHECDNDIEGALRLAKAALTAGNSEALLYLAGLYQGLGDHSNALLMHQKFRKAISFKDARAIRYFTRLRSGPYRNHYSDSVSLMHYSTYDQVDLATVPIIQLYEAGDLTGAAALAQQGATNGDGFPLLLLAQLHHASEVVDEDEIKKLIMQAAEVGNLQARVLLAQEEQYSGNTIEAGRLLQSAADSGSAEALLELGWASEELADLGGARQLYLRARDAGSAAAVYALISLSITETDVGTATQLAYDAARQGDTYALVYLAHELDRVGNPFGALRLLHRAVDAGDPTALEDLAFLHAKTESEGSAQRLRIYGLAADGQVEEPWF